MAEPDLAPLVLAGDDISLTSIDNPVMLTEGSVDVDLLRRDLPELPMQTRLRLNTQYGNYSCMYMCLCYVCLHDRVHCTVVLQYVTDLWLMSIKATKK